MMNHETESPRELKFVCPECRGNSLCAYLSGFVEIEHVFDNGYFTWDNMRPEEISVYYCGGCGYEIEFAEDKDIRKWLIAHCKQDETEAGQSPEDNSGVPAAWY